ncbi:hypothetical protein GCM10022416_43470 [Actinomadura keratinilytica]|uniref:Uncharacterized protein n=2 Tax=Actinomadura keratinilytica TaxID=547461 RepID=A0ABP7Z786_9ACTN
MLYDCHCGVGMTRLLVICGLVIALLAPAWAGSRGATGVLAPRIAPGLTPHPALHRDGERGPVAALRHCAPRCPP